jgi:hypothetical protein
MKTIKIAFSFALLSIALLSGCKKDTFVEASKSSPRVQSTSPLNGAVYVDSGAVVKVKFNTKMDPASITTSSFMIHGASRINGILIYSDSDSSLTFIPDAPFPLNSTFLGRVSNAVKSSEGQRIQSDYDWAFSTGVTPAPLVIATSPDNQATGVSRNKIITATFSEAMDPASISEATFTLYQGVDAISGVVDYSGVVATFDPDNTLLSGTLYTATITNQAKDPSGIFLQVSHTWTFTTAHGPVCVDLKSVEAYGIIAGVGVSNNAGFSEIHDMNVGISPGFRSSITGFPPAIMVNGSIYASDDLVPAGIATVLSDAKQDLTDAYLFAEGASSPAPVTVAGDQGGTTLTPGIYKSTSTLLIQSGNLTLDAQGDANAVWIFQIASDFTTVGGAGGNVLLIGGAQAKNVFWQTGSSATIGDFTSFKGNVMALTSITMNSGATAQGRMLARNGSVVMTSTNIITKP